MNEYVIHFLLGILVQSTMKVSNYTIIQPTLLHPRNLKDVRVGPIFNI